jgi:hypothetical protein
MSVGFVTVNNVFSVFLRYIADIVKNLYLHSVQNIMKIFLILSCTPFALKTASIHRAWTLQGVKIVPHGCWPMLTPILPTVVSSWLDVLLVVDHS